jgi:GPI mannosyltransferase 3
MKTLIRSPYAKLYIAGLIVFLITSYFSLGYHHPDEHFQVLEFANYKLGNSPASDLPWEYQDKIRPALQPFIAFLIIKLLTLLGLHNPFLWAFVLRFLTAITAWYIICKFDEYLLNIFIGAFGRRLFILMTLFLWFVPYIFVRFSSETLAGIFFLYGLYFLLKFDDDKGKSGMFWLGGLLLGFSFCFRFQIGIAILGLVFWLIFIRHTRLKKLFIIAVAAIIAILISLYIDFWFYGEWVLTPVRYFDINILQNKAANWGVHPWWYYFSLFSMKAVPPLSVVLLLLFLTGIYRRWSDVFVFIIVPFLLVHFILGHKEMRFLFPMTYFFIYYSAVGLDFIKERFNPGKFYRVLYKFLLYVNVVILVGVVFTSGQDDMKCYQYIYKYSASRKTIIYCLKKSPYKLAGLEVNFYKPDNVNVLVFNDIEEIHKYLDDHHPASFLFYFRNPVFSKEFNHYRLQRVCVMYPDWLLKYNINHWEDRSTIWSVYEAKLIKNK